MLLPTTASCKKCTGSSGGRRTILDMLRIFGRGNFLALVILVLGVALTAVNVIELKRMQTTLLNHLPSAGAADTAAMAVQKLKYVVYGKNIDSGYLKHVYRVLDRAGYVRANYNSTDDWTLMWAHDYPFKKIRPIIMRMKSWQRVNKLPGSGFVTNKVNLATSGLDSRIPKAFKVPGDVKEFREYAKRFPDKLFVQKNKNHRGIKIETIDKLNLESEGSFIQEFVDDPFLIDGYKFDIGIYTMITSIDPLRIYIFDGDVLLRFCPEKYEPFDPNNKDKYVVHDDYRPTWKVPTMAKYYSDLGYSFKETFNAHLESLGKDPQAIWSATKDVIRNIYRAKEKEFAVAINNYPHKRVFFEMVRFDFVLDAKLNVYLMEANMSPNLSSKHFAMNRLLYEQVLYSLFRLNGILRGGISSTTLTPTSQEEAEMQLAEKDLRVFPEECAGESCAASASACDRRECQLCKQCLASEEIEYLKMAALEHLNRHQCARIFPEPVTRKEASGWKSKTYKDEETESNKKMDQWFAGKCLLDEKWCV